MVKKITVKKIGEFVVDVWKNNFASVEADSTVDVSNEKPKEISPEELKTKIEETYQKLFSFIEEKINECRKEFGGKCISFRNSFEAKNKSERCVNMLRQLNIYPVFEEIITVRADANINEFEEFVKKAKAHPLNKDTIYLNFNMEYTGDHDCDSMDVLYVTYTASKIILREPNKIVSVMPDEKTLRRMATIDTLYRNVYKGINYDCEAIQDYMNGDLTFKGFIKKTNLFSDRSC